MDPIGCAAFLEDQLIEIPFRAIGDIQQDSRHADHLLRAVALDIYGAACQVIGAFGTAAKTIHLFGTVAGRNDDRDVMIFIAIQRILAIAEILQPIRADVAKILDGRA